MIKFVFLLLTVAALSSAKSLIYKEQFSVLTFEGKDAVYVTRVKTQQEREARPNDAILDFTGIVGQFQGYTAEELTVKTDDGYTLVIHRLYKTGVKVDNKVAFLQHGIFGSSDMWVALGPNSSIAFYLADKGYDVYFGNVRGNSYSRVHETLSPNDDEFWNFGLEKVALFDLKKSLDYVLTKTGQQNLMYVGHSMGTTIMFMLLSLEPTYNNKINLYIALTPVAYFKNVLYYAPLNGLVNIVIGTAYLQGTHELFPLSTDTLVEVNKCKASGFCSLGLGFVMNTTNINITTLITYMPASTSRLLVDNFRYLITSGNFQKPDLGCNLLECKNNEVYKQMTPPEYDLKQITASTVIVYSTQDTFGAEDDVKHLISKLGNVVDTIRLEGDKFKHMNAIWPQPETQLFEKVWSAIEKQNAPKTT